MGGEGAGRPEAHRAGGDEGGQVWVHEARGGVAAREERRAEHEPLERDAAVRLGRQEERRGPPQSVVVPKWSVE